MSRCVACNAPIREDYEFNTEPDLCHKCTVIVEITRRDSTPLEWPDRDTVYPVEGVTLPKHSEY